MARKRNFEPDKRAPLDALPAVTSGRAPGVNPTIPQALASVDVPVLKSVAMNSAKALEGPTEIRGFEKGGM